MNSVVKVVRVMGGEVVWLGVLRKAERLESWLLGRARFSDTRCLSSEAGAA